MSAAKVRLKAMPTHYEADEITDLRNRLREAEETLEAIHEGVVDAVVVEGRSGTEIHTLHGPDQPFHTFVESMQEGALTLSSQGEILYANAFFKTLLGRDDLIGESITNFVAPEYSYTCRGLLARGLDRTTKGTLRLINPAGSIPVQLTLSPLTRGDAGTCCGVVFDLREREQVEHANAAREAAEQANLAKDRFLAVLSHELRSPLNSILGWAQILGLRTDLPEAGRRAVQTIERNARAQAQLISDLLDISRIIAGKLHIEFVVVDFKAVVEASVASARLSVGEKPVEIRCNLPDAEVHVSGDATRVQQVVSNLLNNAVKFSEAGGVIEVTLELQERELVLSVRDQGMGIAAEELAPIFDPFRQATQAATSKGGLGLGLAIAKQLVEAHRGRIAASSPGLGAGATFTLHLPRALAPAVAERPALPATQLTGLSVLAVDDDVDSLEMARILLENAGASVVTAESAPAALAAIEKHSFNVILSDVGLPEQDGLALMREIRARGHAAEALPAVALTGYASSSDARLATAAGFQAHLAKPVDAAELLLVIAQLARR